MNPKIFGSMLSPFCYGRWNDNHWWIMFLGFQIISKDRKLKFNLISPKQWTIKLRWFFTSFFFKGSFQGRLKIK